MSVQAEHVERLARGLALVDQLCPRLAEANVEQDLDRVTLRGRAVLADVPFEELQSFCAAGHRVRVQLAVGSWSLSITGEGSRSFSVRSTGSAAEALAEEALDRLNQAAETEDAPAAYAVCEGQEGDFHLLVLNRPEESGVRWFASRARLLEALGGEHWLGVINNLTENGRVTVLVQDAGYEWVAAPGILIQGPDGQPPHASGPMAVTTIDNGYLELLADTDRLKAPPPTAVTPQSFYLLPDVVKQLHSLAAALTWYWLAEHVEVAASAVTVRYRGARVVELPLVPRPRAISTPEVSLFSWATADADVARREAVQHAISLAVTRPDDLDSAAEPVLRTAKSLHELARRGAVAETLATRRSAREAAMAAGRAAAQAAREAATKAVERSITQTVAAGALVLARTEDLIKPEVARNLLFLIAAIVTVAAVVSAVVEIPSGRNILGSFDADLEQYREALSEDDIKAIRNADSLRRAKRDLLKAQITATVLYAGVLVAVLVLAVRLTA
jgi:hypothetical protein